MRILFRYVFREFCVPLGYCLTGFISIYVLFELFASFSRLADAKPGFAKTVLYFAGYLAPYFEWLAPACLMLAALYTMWRFCRHSEVVAMRASGIGFFTIVKPMLLVAALMALVVAAVNECFVPRYAQWAKNFRAARFDEAAFAKADNIVFHNAAANRTWQVGMIVTPDASVLESVRVTVDRPAGGGRLYNLEAPRVEYLDGQWWFDHPEVKYFDSAGRAAPSPSPDLDQLTLRTFGFEETPRDFVLQNRDWEYFSVADRVHYLRANTSLDPARRVSYVYDAWAQAAAPLACLVITLFAIPMGVATGRQSVFKGILGALVLFFAFYATTILFMVFAKKGICPAVPAAFIPDVLFLVAGLWLFRRQR